MKNKIKIFKKNDKFFFPQELINLIYYTEMVTFAIYYNDG